MARQVLPIVGAIIGGMYGGATGAQLGWAIGSIVGNAVDPEIIKGPRIGEAGLQTSAEGVFRPVVLGTGAVKGNIIARGNRRIRVKRDRQGKGGPVTETERVYWTFAIRICEGPIAGVTRIWMDEKLVYDIRPDSTIPQESFEFAKRFRLYAGDEEQLPDPDLEAYMGVGNAPAYRGTAYIVFPNYDLTDYRERIPDFRFEVAGREMVISDWQYDWTEGTHPSTAINSLCWAPPLACFIATKNNVIYLSEDGLSWDAVHETSGTNRYTGVGYSYEQQKVFVVSNAGIGMSGNGVQWEFRTFPLSIAVSVVGCVGNAGEYVVTGGLSTALSYSYKDGELLMGVNGVLQPRDICHSPKLSLYLCVGSDDDTTKRLGISSTGREWSFPTDLPHVYDTCAWSEELGLFVIGTRDGSASPRLKYSIDGQTFADCTITGLSSDWRPGKIVWAKELKLFVAVPANGAGPGSTFGISVDGKHWTAGGSIPTGNYAALAWGYPGLGKLCAMTSGGFTNRSVVSNSSIEISGSLTLAEAVTVISQRANVSPSRIDVSELTDTMYGLVLAGDYTCDDAIRTLMPVYFFDAAEYDGGSGYKIHFPKRGKPVVATLTIDDLIEAPEKTVREDALERPRVLHLHYENPTVGYVPAKATARRDTPDVHVVGERSLQVPVAFTSVDEPARIANKLLKTVWVEVGGEEEFTIHDGWLELVTADCIGVSLRGQVRRMRITQMFVDQGEIRLKLMPDRQSTYTSNVTGVPLPAPTPPPPSVAGPTVFEFLDLPALTDAHDHLHYYAAATGQTKAWTGAEVQRSVGSTTSFSGVSRFTLNTIMGVLLEDVPEAPEHYTDTTNVVKVQLYTDDVLDSLTHEEFLSEGGAFALEKPDGSWEILQYRDASEEGDRVFHLSTLLRGRLNTGASAHAAGARFVLLDAVRSIEASTAHIGATLKHRAVSFGTSPETAEVHTSTYVAKAQTEWPCAHLTLARAGTTITATCVPRHRLGTEVRPVRSQHWMGYRWTVTDGTNSRTVDSLTETQAFDVTGWASPVTVSVAQVNRYTGAGPSISEQIA